MRRHVLAFFSLAVKGRKVLLGRDAGLGKALKFCWGRDAGLGKPSPTQTGQRSGELIAKGGMACPNQLVFCAKVKIHVMNAFYLS